MSERASRIAHAILSKFPRAVRPWRVAGPSCEYVLDYLGIRLAEVTEPGLSRLVADHVCPQCTGTTNRPIAEASQ